MDTAALEKWLKEFTGLTGGRKFTDKIILAAPFSQIKMVSDHCAANGLFCSTQDISQFGQGAHTGEVGAFQVRQYCQFSIVGHSERAETEDTVLAKRDACLAQGVSPVVCFAQKENWNKYYLPGVFLTWEDPLNISQNGLYRDKDPQEIEETYKYFAQAAPELAMIYGGSVNRQNTTRLAGIPNLGGVLVGNASLDPQHFMDIISAFE